MKTRRIAPGVYEVDTPYGLALIDRVETAYGLTWMLTYPGQETPNSAATTLRQAKQWLELWVRDGGVAA